VDASCAPQAPLAAFRALLRAANPYCRSGVTRSSSADPLLGFLSPLQGLSRSSRARRAYRVPLLRFLRMTFWLPRGVAPHISSSSPDDASAVFPTSTVA
jgi:hypothetical protein